MRGRRQPRRLAIAVAPVGAIILLAACTGPGAPEAAHVAEMFSQLAATNPEQACGLLSEHARSSMEKEADAPCTTALTDAGLPKPSAVRSVEVYATDGIVVLEGDVIFLARFGEGWRVTAAGCRPEPEDQPYDCGISGG